jgi:hypothetical protein
MNKWGIRLIGLLFFIWAIGKTFMLILDPHASGRFPISIYLFTYNGIGQIDIMGWVGICILFYTGYHLIKFDKTGRIWALIILWPYTIYLGALFTAALVSFFFSPIREYLTSSIISSQKLETPWTFSLLFGGPFVCFLFPLYFLLRKENKLLFHKAVSKDENNN